MRLDDQLEDVTIQWSTKWACPVYTLANGKKYAASTGLTGYYDEITEVVETPEERKKRLSDHCEDL